MKKNIIELQQLIQSLTKAECRYFKLFVKGNKESKYLQLFELLHNKNDYKPKKLEALLEKKGLLKNIRNIQSYTKDLILKSLEVLHSSKSIEQEMLSNLKRVKILFDKKLYNHALNIVKESLKLSEDYYLTHFEPLLYYWLLKIHNILRFNLPDGAQFIELLNAYSSKINQLQTEVEYEQLIHSGIFYLIKPKEGEKINLLQSINQKICLFQENKVSPKARVLAYQAQAISLSTNSEYYKCVEVYQKARKYMESGKYPIKADPLKYFGILMDLMVMQAKANLWNSVEETIQIITDLKTEMPLIASETLDDILLGMQLVQPVMTNNLQKLLEETTKTEQRLKNSNISKYRKIRLLHHLSNAFFIAEKYNDALNQIDTILDLKDKKFESNYHNALILRTMIYLEKEEWLLLPDLIRSVSRYTNNKGKLSVLDNLLLRYIKKLSNAKSKAKEIQLCQKAIIEIEALLKNEEQKDTVKFQLRQFDYIIWFKSKIHNIPLIEAFEKFGLLIY